MARGLILSRNQAISCLNMSGGSARESNPPTPLVTRHNGFEVRSYSYQCVRLAPPTWQLTPRLYQCVRLVGSSRGKFSHIFSHLVWLVVDSIYDGKIGVSCVVSSDGSDGLILVAVVPRKRRISIRKLKYGVDVGLPTGHLVFENGNFGVPRN